MSASCRKRALYLALNTGACTPPQHVQQMHHLQGSSCHPEVTEYLTPGVADYMGLAYCPDAKQAWVETTSAEMCTAAPQLYARLQQAALCGRCSLKLMQNHMSLCSCSMHTLTAGASMYISLIK